MRSQVNMFQKREETIAFVPTMGYLHEGHLSLMKKGSASADRLVVSIFVNPTQFGENEDLDSYPQDIEKDTALTRETGADILFTPTKADFYPKGYRTFVEVEKWSYILCGEHRPVHFKGVTTIVSKLFNIIQPRIAIFGQKDFQQVAIVKQMTRDLNYNIQILSMPTVREKDGLAMSSRNAYLSKSDRAHANVLYQSLIEAQKLVNEGTLDSKQILGMAEEKIMRHKNAVIDYIDVVDPDTLEPVRTITKSAILAMAVRIGKTRLIDNMLLQQNKHLT